MIVASSTQRSTKYLDLLALPSNITPAHIPVDHPIWPERRGEIHSVRLFTTLKGSELRCHSGRLLWKTTRPGISSKILRSWENFYKSTNGMYLEVPGSVVLLIIDLFIDLKPSMIHFSCRVLPFPWRMHRQIKISQLWILINLRAVLKFSLIQTVSRL